MASKDGYEEEEGGRTQNDNEDNNANAVATKAAWTIWQLADSSRHAIIKNNGTSDALPNDDECSVLVQRTLDAERQLKDAHAELREVLFQIRMEGHPLHSMSSGCMKCGLKRRLFPSKPRNYWLCAQCWYDSFGKWPAAPLAPTRLKRELLFSVYDMCFEDYLGQGVFSTVRRAENIATLDRVAVKSYSVDCDANFQLYTQMFLRGVDTLLLLASQDTPYPSSDDEFSSEGFDASESMMQFPTASELFVRLIEFSRDDTGSPGFYGITDDYVMILEYGEKTLDSYLQCRIDDGTCLALSEVIDIFLQIVQPVAMLHEKGFVHCDLKPLNIMYFNACGRWKLLDIDGVLPARSSTYPCNVFYTPIYCAPELALQLTTSQGPVKISKRSDIWSLGTILVELVSLRPWLQDTLEDFLELGIEDNGSEWLATESKSTKIPPILSELDPRLEFLCSRMLECDVELRSTLVDVMIHPFLHDMEILHGDFEPVSHNVQLDRADLVGRFTCVKQNVFVVCDDHDDLGKPGMTQIPQICLSADRNQSYAAERREMQRTPQRQIDANMDWSKLREYSCTLHERAAEFSFLLQQHQRKATGTRAIAWADAEREAALLWEGEPSMALYRFV